MSNEIASSATLLSLPPAGAAHRGLGESFQADLYTGSGVYTIALELPAAQNGFKPDLTLKYSSGAPDGPFGLGWQVPFLSIQRSARRGIPIYDDQQDIFILSGGDDLVPVGGGIYRPRVDTRGWRIERTGDHWRVTTKDGVVHVLGRTANARVEQPGGTGTFAWLLEEIINPTGQSALFRYREAGPNRVIETVSYGPFRAVFRYEDRPDPFVSRRSGFLIIHELRCIEIRIESDRSPYAWIRKYLLSYASQATRPDSLLSRVVLEAGEGERRLAMPDLNFEYGQWDPSRISTLQLDPDPDGSLPAVSDPDTEILDLQGAGRPGILHGSAAGWTYWPNLGNGRFGPARLLTNIPTVLTPGSAEARFADLEGNGTSDLLWGAAGGQGFFPNAAAGQWEDFIPYLRPLAFDLTSPEFRLYDMDGDGKVDAVVTTPDSFLVFKNFGVAGWSDEAIRVPRVFDAEVFPDVSFSDVNVFTADMTGDGLTDIIRVINGEVVYWPYSGFGRWGRKVSMASSPALPPGFDPLRVRLADVDGDGLADFVYLGDQQVHIWFNRRGEVWSAETIVPVPGFASAGAVLADMLGNGRPGILWSVFEPALGREVYRFLSFGGAPEDNFLVRIAGGLGHTTRILYSMSSEDRLRDEAEGRVWQTFMPFPVPVVESVEQNDAPAGILVRTRYTYSDGHFDGLERNFNGFRKVAQLKGGDESTPDELTITEFHPGTDPMPERERRQLDLGTRLRAYSLRGSPIKVARFDAGTTAAPPELVDHTTNRWSSRLDFDQIEGRVAVPFSIDAVTDEPRVGGEGRRTIVRHGEPDRLINPTWTEYEVGILDSHGLFLSAGKRRERSLYIDQNTFASSHWTPGLIAERMTIDGDDHVLACVRWHYDGELFESLPFRQADRGVVSRVEELVFIDVGAGVAQDLAALGYHRLAGNDVSAPGWYRVRNQLRIGPNGETRAARNALGHVTEIDYDAWGIDPIRTTDALGLTTQAQHDYAVEQVAALTNASGLTERRSYDALGRTRHVYRTGKTGGLELVGVTFYDEGDFSAGGDGQRPCSVTTITPWTAGRDPAELEQASVTPQALREASALRRYYSATGLELEAVSSAPNDGTSLPGTVRTGERAFNVRGAVKAEARPVRDTSFSPRSFHEADLPFRRLYDVSGRERLITFPRGQREQRFEPLVTAIADANAVADGTGPSIKRHFDAFGRLSAVRERVGDSEVATHRFEYSNQGLLTKVVDPNGQTLCEYTYDCIGHMVRARHRDAGESRYSFDAVGNLVRTMCPTGQTLTFRYDAGSRLIGTVDRHADGTVRSTNGYFYDRSRDNASIAPGKVCEVEDDAGVTIYEYAVDGSLTGKRRTTPSGRTLRFRYAYDHRGLLTACTYPDDTTIGYRYGAAGEIVAIDGFVDRIDYDPRGHPVTLRYSNGIETHFAYDETERPVSVATSLPGGALLGLFEQDYDRVGNPIRLLAEIDGMPREEKRLTYDGLNRLIGASIRRGTAVSNHQFRYDLAGNLLENSEHGLAALRYEDPTRTGLLTALLQVGGQSATTRTYDTAGRLLTSESLAAAEYGASNQLVSAVTPTGAFHKFTYDAQGHRATAEALYPDGSCSSALYFDDLFEERDGVSTIYVQGLGGLTASISRHGQSIAVAIHHHDPQGNVRLSTDENAAVIARHSYTSFGLDASTGTTGEAYMGKRADAELGLIQLGIRFYEPLTGRFTTPDLFVFERPLTGLADPSAFNLYAYAINNPHRYHDPRGRFVWVLVIVGVAIGSTLGYMAAKENGQDPWLGALIGGLVGGLTGGAGLLPEALFGAALGAASAAVSGDRRIWTGAALGFGFGALGGAVSSWTPVVGGEGIFAKGANALIEIGADALVSGAAAGTSSALAGKSFGTGFTSGLAMGAMMSGANVAIFGVRYDPASIKADFSCKVGEQYKLQGNIDKLNYVSERVAAAGMPSTSSVTYRTGGIINLLNGGRSVTFANTVRTSADTMAELRSGNFTTMAHELRHIAQERATTLGTVEFLAVWTFQFVTNREQFYKAGPGNTTLEVPYH